MKKIIIGFIVGALMFSIIPVMAEGELTVVPNPFPVVIDGEIAEVEGYNIDGYTYLKLADIGKTGLTVKFNETEGQIEITSTEGVESAERSEPPLEISIIVPEPNVMKETPDGVRVTPDGNGEYFVTLISWSNTDYPQNGYKIQNYTDYEDGEYVAKYYDSDKKNHPVYWVLKKNREVLSDNIQTKVISGSTAVTYDYYVNTILPLLIK